MERRKSTPQCSFSKPRAALLLIEESPSGQPSLLDSTSSHECVGRYLIEGIPVAEKEVLQVLVPWKGFQGRSLLSIHPLLLLPTFCKAGGNPNENPNPKLYPMPRTKANEVFPIQSLLTQEPKFRVHSSLQTEFRRGIAAGRFLLLCLKI